MPRGKGTQRYACYCRNCRRMFKARREDALTCSDRCRKAWNRLMSGVSSTAGSDTGEAVTDQRIAGPCRILLNGRWVASKGTREEAELFIHGMLEMWDGEFSIVPAKGKR